MRRSMARWLLCWSLLASSVSAQDGKLLTVDGGIATGVLKTVSDGVASFEVAGQMREVALDEVVRWGCLVRPRHGNQVLLVDGSTLLGHVAQLQDDELELESGTWGEVTLPRSKVVAIVWQLPTGIVEQWKQRDQMRSSAEDLETLTLKNGDTRTGRLVRADSEQLTFFSDGRHVEVDRELVASWRRPYQPTDSGQPEEETPNSTLFVGLNDGTELVASSVRLGGRFEVALLCGLQLRTDSVIRPVVEQLLCYLRPNSARVGYLAEFPTLGYRHVPFVGGAWDWSQDRNVLGGPLAFSSSQYVAKGIGMHSSSRLAFELDGNWEEFQAELCVDALAGKRGSVVFRVFLFADSWREAYTSPSVRGGEEPLPMRVKLEGAKRIALVVGFSHRGDILDHANWLGARLTK